MKNSNFYMSSLKDIKQKMTKLNIQQVTFPFEYSKKPFSCIFAINTVPYRMYMSTLGDYPITLEFEIKSGYLIEVYIPREKYDALLKYLNLRFNPEYPFKPVSLFKALNDKLPYTKLYKAKISTVLKTVSQVRLVEESEKIYFIGWRHLPEGQKVSQYNNDKTRIAFGDKIATDCLNFNISSCWSDIPTDERPVDFSMLYKQ